MNIGIIGATGYTGSELARILYQHPHVNLKYVSSETYQGRVFSEIHPQFQGLVDIHLSSAQDLLDEKPDLVFLALPHGISMQYAKSCIELGIKTIDLSADFRLSSSSSYKDWYHQEHSFEEGFDLAVYGLPELYKHEIASAKLIANPGCYPTSALLGMAPLLSEGLLDSSCIIVDAKSGVTGAGIKPKIGTHFSNVNDNFKAYGLKNHRHSIEIQEQACKISNSDQLVQFTPHLLPIDRGILATTYLRPSGKIKKAELTQCFESFFQDKPFVRLVDTPPSVKQVRGTNYCDIFCDFDDRTQQIMVVSVIDNLVKGAAGQAIQNMNIQLNLDEAAGLKTVPLYP